MSKRPSDPTDSGQIEDGPGAAKKSRVEKEDNSSNENEVNSASSLKFEVPVTSITKGEDVGHGPRFQSKLLMLYAMRAMNSGYQFSLGTELQDVGGKFDDLIFKYKDKNDTTTCRCHYLQAKHKLNENDPNKQINANQLLSKDKDFDLKKYFESYVKIKNSGDDIEHCIICTNADFDYLDLKNKGIELDPLTEENWPKMLDCAIYKTQQAFYKFKVNVELRKGMAGNDPLVNNFFDKMIFSVKTPNEDELGDIPTEDGKYLNLLNPSFLPSAFVMKEIVNWYEKINIKHYQLTPDKVKEILSGKAAKFMELCHTTSPSIEFQNQLGKVPFNDTAVDQLKQELNKFWKFFKSRGYDIEHYIICTNVDFDYFDLMEEGIKLNRWAKEDPWPRMLACAVYKTKQAFYKFKVNKKLSDHLDNHPLVNEFFDKLIFSVNTPNEGELDSILAEEVGKYFKLSNNVLPSAYIEKNMVNWFKIQHDQKHFWLTRDKAKEILKEKTEECMALYRTTSLSIDYQEQLQKVVEFNDTAIVQLKHELNKFWNNPQAKVELIHSETPKLTVVKVISAVNKMPEFPNIDDYLVISSNRLKTNKKDLDLSVEVAICHRLLIVVDEDANPQLNVDCENLIPAKSKKKILLISNQNFNNKTYNDLIAYEHLSEKTKEILGKKQISFQGTDKTVNELIDLGKADKALDPQSIENLLHMADDNIIEIPSFTCSNFQESLYIKRQVAFPSTDELIKKLSRKRNCSVEELMEKCRVDSNGRIQWFAKDEKENLWKDIGEILKEMNSPDSSSLATLPEETLFDPCNKKRVIIMGVAGTGKSTILSNYYKEIKKANSDWWIIKINLVDHTSALRKIDSKDVSDFFINATGIDQNPFAQLLLKHRLETGDRIVLILDGFDEINEECQNKVIQLVKSLKESIPLYITTRPHIANQLQFELSQLAYNLVKFKEEDRMNYLTSIWTAYSTKEKVDYDEMTIKSCAAKLIERVAKTLSDEENEFIGIPLQCRILAECFQSKIIQIKSLDDFSHFLDVQQFDLANLYKMMFEEKRRVFREEKIKCDSVNNHIANESIDKSTRKTELYLRKLAIQTIVDEKQYVDILIPSANFKSEIERKEKEKQLNESGIRFGLLDEKNDGNNTIQFLHRTYAEYLLADYIYNGFLLDEERHNRLLENESIRKWIINEMLVEDKYNGCRVFLDSMLKDIVNHEEWKNRMKQRNLPVRLQQFTSLLCDQRKERNRALGVAFDGRNGNTLLFIFDCFDVQLTSSETRSVILNDIESPFNQRIDVFQRILNYFNDADDRQLEGFLEKLRNDNFWLQSTSALELKQDNVKSKIENFLDFMESHREKVKFVLDYVQKCVRDVLVFHSCRYEDMPIFFLRHGDDELIKKYFTLLSSIYSNDFDLTRFMKKIILKYRTERKDWQIGQIENALIILGELGRINVLPELSRYVLIRCSEIFKQDDNIEIRLWLEEMGMTGLHGMAFRGDLKSIEEHIGCSLEKPETDTENVRKSVLRLMLNNINIVDTLEQNRSQEFIVTLFEVAAVYGHDEICRKIIKFLLGLYRWKCLDKQKMDDTIENYENVAMIRTILKSATAVLGQDALIDILKPVFSDNRTSVKPIFETMFCVVVEDKLHGYRDANELVFQNDYSIQTLEHVPSSDILQGMISEGGGFDDWMNRLMKTDIKRAFDVLSSYGFLDKLDQKNQIPKLIDILTTLRPSKEGTTSSYWSEYVKHKNSTAEYFLKVVTKKFGEEDLKRLLFARDEKNIFVIFIFLIRNGRDCLERIFSNLPEQFKKGILNLANFELLS